MLFEFNYFDFIFQGVDFDALSIVEHQIPVLAFDLHTTGSRTGDGLQAFFLGGDKNVGAFQVGGAVFVDEKHPVATG